MNKLKYLAIGMLIGAFALPFQWIGEPVQLAMGQTVTVDSTQSPIVVNALADLADLTPSDGQSVIIKTGTEKGLWYYDKDSAAVVDSVAVLTGPGSVGRFLVITNDIGSIAAATAITAAQIDNDVDIEFGVFDADSPRSLTLSELKKTGIQVINVKQYGATGDGVADDTAEIQAAIDAALALSTQDSPTVQAAGKAPVVYFPAGIYKISSTLSVGSNSVGYYSSIRLIGAGMHLSVIQAVSTATDATMPYMIDFPAVTDADANNQWHIEGLCLEGTNPWNNGDSITGINMLKSAYATVKDCMIRYFDKGIEIRNWSNVIDGCRIEYCTTGIYVSESDGIDGQTTINDLIFTRNSFGTVDYGIHTAKSEPINYLKITDSQFDGESRAAVLFNGPVAQFQIQNNYFELQGTTGTATIATNESGGTATCNGAIVMHPTTNNVNGANGTISGNLFINCNLTSIISSSGNKTLTITDNAIESASTVVTFVDFTDASGIPSGPLPYSTTGRILVDGSRKNSAAAVVVTSLCTVANADTDGTSCIIVRDRSGYTSRGFCLNDPADLINYNAATGTFVKSRSADGCVMFTHNSGTGTLDKGIEVTVDENSPLSGSMLRLTGMVMCDDGGGAISASIGWDTGGSAVYTEHIISYSDTAGVWGKSWNLTYRVPVVASGTKTMLIRIKRHTSIPGGTNVYLKNFAICSASAELGEESVLLID